MKTPVIIPAFDEAEHIGSTLRALDATTTEPFVIVNGEKGARETAEVASSYTPNVYIRPEQGKLPAIQFALKMLMKSDTHALAEPILFSDADSRPLAPRQWAHTMGQAVAGSVACSAAGLTLFSDGPLLDRSVRNARRIMRAREDSGTSSLRSSFGANMALNFANNHDLIDQTLNLPHIWPGEDRYLLHMIGGDKREHFTQLASRGSTVLQSARFMKPISSVLKEDLATRQADTIRHYISRRARTSTHYFQDETGVLLEHTKEPA